MPPKGGNAKKEGGRAKKADNEAKKQEQAASEKVRLICRAGSLAHRPPYLIPLYRNARRPKSGPTRMSRVARRRQRIRKRSARPISRGKAENARPPSRRGGRDIRREAKGPLRRRRARPRPKRASQPAPAPSPLVDSHLHLSRQILSLTSRRRWRALRRRASTTRST